MSLAIDVDLVTAVLLADGWHDVDDATFSLDSYEYLWSGRDGVSVNELYDEFPQKEPLTMHGGGRSGVCATGFSFRSKTYRLFGPLTAILAVKTDA